MSPQPHQPDAFPVTACPPGEYLQDELDARGWTVARFADRSGLSAQTATDIINAKVDLTPETAQAISDAFGTTAQLWMNLQAAYTRRSGIKLRSDAARS